MSIYESRRRSFRRWLHRRRIAWGLITDPRHIYYLTGFRGSTGVAVVGEGTCRLWVDPRYTLQARAEAPEAEVCEEERGLVKAAARWLSAQPAKRVGYEDKFMICHDFDRLKRYGGSRLQLVPLGEILQRLRVVKDSSEVEHIRQAGMITAQVFEELFPMLRPGLKESDLAAEIEYRLRQKGAEGAAFSTIVASGPRSAMPHARSTSKLLQKNELVIFDLGAILCGYAADMTRTVFLGRPGKDVRLWYATVREAQAYATSTVRAGAHAEEVDCQARRILARRHLDRYFTHSTGHGVGLEIHERPRLARGQKAILQAGCVVTVEPGIYLAGKGGVRIEDTVLVTARGAEILTPASKDLWWIS